MAAFMSSAILASWASRSRRRPSCATRRQGRQDYARFLDIAEGSLAETEYLLILARDLGYIAAEEADPRFADIAEVARMLHALRVKVEEPR